MAAAGAGGAAGGPRAGAPAGSGGVAGGGGGGRAARAVRWALATEAWEPGEEEWAFLLSLLPAEEAEDVRRFRREEDRKRALGSRVMQRACIQRVAGVPWREAEIARTKGRKPFLRAPHREPDLGLPNFNFNVSHEGHYVVLASESVCVVGVDVAAPAQVRPRGGGEEMGLAELRDTFGGQLTEQEWQAVASSGGDAQARNAFQRYWSCKEAFVKARGDGLGFELKRCEFFFEGGPDTYIAHVKVDGRREPAWRLFLQRLGEHWVTVARGPPQDVVDAHGEFMASLQRRDFAREEWDQELNAPSPPFVPVNIADMLPKDVRGEYIERFDDSPF